MDLDLFFLKILELNYKFYALNSNHKLIFALER